MKVLGQSLVNMVIVDRVNSIRGFQYPAKTQLRYQSLDNRLKDEPRVGTPIRRSLFKTASKVVVFNKRNKLLLRIKRPILINLDYLSI